MLHFHLVPEGEGPLLMSPLALHGGSIYSNIKQKQKQKTKTNNNNNNNNKTLKTKDKEQNKTGPDISAKLVLPVYSLGWEGGMH